MREFPYDLVVACLAVSAALSTIVCAVTMAQPWGDNYAYGDVWGYLVLLGFLAWACAPYLYLYCISRRTAVSRALKVSRIILALIVCVGGVAILIDITFIHLDAQGGLALLFIPIYQWIAIGVVMSVGVLLSKRGFSAGG
jgi:hypothetical protein